MNPLPSLGEVERRALSPLIYAHVILLAGCLFHAMIGLCMNIWLFSASMIVFYLAFLSEDEADAALNHIKSQLSGLAKSFGVA